MENKLNSLLENGWLSRLVFKSNHLEKSIAKWTFSLMLSKEELMASACEFWCSILSSRNVVDKPVTLFECLPTFSEIKQPLEIYGFIWIHQALHLTQKCWIMHMIVLGHLKTLQFGLDL